MSPSCQLFDRGRRSRFEAAEELWRSEGIEAEVIDLRTLRPLDTQAVLDSLLPRPIVWLSRKRVGRLARSRRKSWPFAWRRVSTTSTRRSLRVCNEDVPLPYAANLEKLALIDKDGVIEACKKVCYAD